MLKVIGPGAIMAATSIGGGEWLVGPAVAVKYGTQLFLIATVAIVLQVIFNLEAIRYTLYTGEPILAGIMRLKPGPTILGGQLRGARLPPARLAGARGQRRRDPVRRLDLAHAGPADHGAQAWIATGLILAVVLILSFGGTIERMLEYLRLDHARRRLRVPADRERAFVPFSHWVETLFGFFTFSGLPHPIDWGLIGALAATAGSGGLGNLTVSNWIRDKGFGMGALVGAIPSAVGGHAVQLSPVGAVFPATPANLARWREWLRYVHVDQVWVWGLFCFLGMYLNVNLATAIVPHGTDLQGLAAGAYQAKYLAQIWPGFWFLTLFNGFWILFKTQLGNTDVLVRTTADAVWMSHPRVHSGVGIRGVYYGILALFSVWGVVAIRVGVALPALQGARERGGSGARDRRDPDLPRQPALPAAGGAPAALARGGPAALRGLLRVLRLVRPPRRAVGPAAIARSAVSSAIQATGDVRERTPTSGRWRRCCGWSARPTILAAARRPARNALPRSRCRAPRPRRRRSSCTRGE